MKKNISITFFSFKRDGECLIAGLQSFRAFFPEASLFVVDDHKNPLINEHVAQLESLGVSYEKSTFKRKGNLNGQEAVEGITSYLLKNAKKCGAEFSFKADSDVMMMTGLFRECFESNVNEKDAIFTKHNFLFTDGNRRDVGFGLFYGIRVSLLERVHEAVKNGESIPFIPEHLPEDVWISSLCIRLSEKQVDLLPQTINNKTLFAGWTNGKRGFGVKQYKEFSIIHFGERHAGTVKEMERDMKICLSILKKKFLK